MYFSGVVSLLYVFLSVQTQLEPKVAISKSKTLSPQQVQLCLWYLLIQKRSDETKFLEPVEGGNLV